LLAAPVVLLGWMAAAQVQEQTSLIESLATTYNSNPTLAAARAQLRATNEQVPQELANWRPDVQVSGSLGTATERSRRTGSSTPAGATGVGGSLGGDDGFEGTTPRQARLTVTQPLYRGGRTVAGTERAENEVFAERARLASTEQQVLLAAATAFMDVWRDEAVLRLNLNNEQVLARQLEASRDRLGVGGITHTDVGKS